MMRHDAQEAGAAHLRALGFEACAVFYNVSAAYLALLQPAAALPYLCKARMLARSLGLADGSGQAVHTARRSHIGGAIESALALTLRRPPFLLPPSRPGALSLMHCTSLCRGAPFCQRAPKQAILPCRQRTSLGSAALRCRLLGAHQDWRTNTARDANRPRLPLSRSPRAAEHAPPQSVDQARMSPRAPL